MKSLIHLQCKKRRSVRTSFKQRFASVSLLVKVSAPFNCEMYKSVGKPLTTCQCLCQLLGNAICLQHMSRKLLIMMALLMMSSLLVEAHFFLHLMP